MADGDAPTILEALSSDALPAAPRVKSADIRGVINMNAGPGTAEYLAKIVAPAPDAEIAGSFDVETGTVRRADTSQPSGPALTVPESTGGKRAVEQNRRVAVYCGRGNSFVVAVEEAPDWEPVEQWKIEDPKIIGEYIKPLVETLEIKFIDRSGGELKEALKPANVRDLPKPEDRPKRVAK